eukprot:2367617-Pleurochrysis_carterae.AAC.1
MGAAPSHLWSHERREAERRSEWRSRGDDQRSRRAASASSARNGDGWRGSGRNKCGTQPR